MQSVVEHNDPVIRVVGINGSLRDGSYTRLAVKLALQGAEAVGAQTHLIEMGDRTGKPGRRFIDQTGPT